MKIGFLLDDRGFENVDLSKPRCGNPGVGGTQFCFAMLMDALCRNNQFTIHCFHFNLNKLPSGVTESMVRDDIEAIRLCKQLQIDIFVIKSPGDVKVFDEIDAQGVKTISWAHNYIIGENVKRHMKSSSIRRVIFVGKEQYDRYIDCDLIDKSDYIYNMFAGNETWQRNKDLKNVVTYTGSLVKVKGFHVLAKAWKQVRKQVPDAELYVMGSGKLYDNKATLGKYGVASQQYEKEFMPWLLDTAGNPDSSVRFLGTVGEEKNDYYAQTKVGVVNPSARTETFGLSAVEMAAFGIPVCTKGSNGLLDTVIHSKTGLLSHTSGRLAKNIVRLLKDESLNAQLGQQGKAFIERFEPENIIGKWQQTFEDVYHDIAPKYQKPTGNYGNNAKWLRIIIRFLRKKMRIAKLASFVELEGVIKSRIRR